MVNRIRSASSAAILALLLASCAGIPTDGPSTRAIVGGDPANLRIEPLDLTSVAALATATPISASAYPPVATPVRTLLQAGDTVTITLFEGLPDGVFGSTSTGGSQFKGLLVRQDGSVQVPFVGRLRAAGRDTEDLRRDIISSVRRFAARPDAVVSIETRNMGYVSITGAVTTPGRMVIGSDILTVQEALSKAGAPFNKPYTTQILIRSTSGVQTMTLADVMVRAPITLTGDTDVVVSLEPAIFRALGAVRSAGPHEINYADLSLLDALGIVGGLDPSRANPKGVFLFRAATHGSADQRPIIYQLSMAKPEAFAIADAFEIRPGDTLYVTEAPVAQWTKILAAIQGTIGLGATGATIGNLAD
ncbi:MAG: polysaccharide biosynthesis/export family protein [Brevundimonas sp.]